MQLGSMFISNCNNYSTCFGRFLRPSSGALKNCSSSLWCMTWDGVKYLGRPYWILHPVSCHTPEVATTVSKCSWGWTQKASETCRVIIAVTNKHTAKLRHFGSLYILTYDARKLKHKITVDVWLLTSIYQKTFNNIMKLQGDDVKLTTRITFKALNLNSEFIV